MGQAPTARRTTVSVGGVVLHGDRALLVRRSAAGREGDWQIPGGFMDSGESLLAAARREVREETGVDAAVVGLLAVLNRVTEGENNTYFIFLLTTETSTAVADGEEVDAAEFLGLEQLSRLPRLQSLSDLVVRSALSDSPGVFLTYRHPQIPLESAVLFMGEGAGATFKSLSHLLWYEPRIPG